jgi:hypothetical protein
LEAVLCFDIACQWYYLTSHYDIAPHEEVQPEISGVSSFSTSLYVPVCGIYFMPGEDVARELALQWGEAEAVTAVALKHEPIESIAQSANSVVEIGLDEQSISVNLPV